ncbi:helix-turn-helix domain-containing protein [Burkholderia cepacia]|uniref:helix-turn-helix transcriptional regulator n=1 Tax=Burkholderia cepacia TaxID=292 RepID=UPI001CF254C9|nr:helix-turn-helix domain-containing protein [Burkholderia cepacia]MCA7902613.1 helix-turn-helix domain-containing protein [Burkholderia cepacia]
MDIVHFNRRQLAARWGVSEATLERWRSDGIGPRYLKLVGTVVYRHVDVEAFEEASARAATPGKRKPRPQTAPVDESSISDRSFDFSRLVGPAQRWYRVVGAQGAKVASDAHSLFESDNNASELRD